MKYLAIVFSFYIALITLVPCQDAKDISVYDNLISFSKPEKGVAHCGQEICSPLCSCACCSVSRDFLQPTSHSLIANTLNVKYCEYKTPATAEQLIEIDQPPQIV